MRWHKRPEYRMLIYLGVIALLTIAGTVAIFLINLPSITGFAVNDEANPASASDVKIGTFAVCENKDSYTLCKDKIYASCNKTPVEVSEGVFECNGRIYDIGKTELGETYLPSDWSDPRPANTITAWAASE